MRSNARAIETGLQPRPLEDTVRDTLAWIDESGAGPMEGWGITDEREAELLAAWRAQGFYLRERIDLEGWASLRLGV